MPNLPMSRVVENINQVGHVSSLMHYVIYPRSLCKSAGLQHIWVQDTENAVANTNLGWEIGRKYVIKGATAAEAKGTLRISPTN